MSIEGQGHFLTIYFPGFVCFVLYLDKISGERLQDHWSSGCFTQLKCHLDQKRVVVHVSYNYTRVTKPLFISARPPYGSHTGAITVRFLCMARRLNLCMISTRYLHGRSTDLHFSVVETHKRNCTMAVLNLNKYAVTSSYLRCIKAYGKT